MRGILVAWSKLLMATELRYRMSVTRPNAGPRKTPRTAQMQFREWVGLLISLCIIGVILVSAFDTFSSVLFSHVSSEASLGGVRPRAGHILVETDSEHCRQFTFDNDNGKIVPSRVPCEQQLHDAQGALVPTGTIHR